MKIKKNIMNNKNAENLKLYQEILQKINVKNFKRN